MRRKAFTFWQAAGLLAGMVVLAAIFFPMFGTARGPGHRGPTCQSNLKQIGLGMLQYNQDYNGYFPPVSSDAGGWNEIIYPYVKTQQIFHCPQAKTDTSRETSDYFYNSRLVGMRYTGIPGQTITNLAVPGTTIAVGDGLANALTDANFPQLPSSWRVDSSSPAARHDGMANYLFADGHVKALSADEIDEDGLRKTPNSFTFGVR